MSLQSLVSNRPTLPALLCLISALAALAVADDKVCAAPTGDGAQSTCTCQTDAGQIIDLRPLDLAQKSGKPKFSGLKGASYSYSYNPCTPFNDGAKCKNIFICQHVIGSSTEFTVASVEVQILQNASGNYYIHYTGPSRDTKVYLNCDQCNRDGAITSITQPNKADYALQLYSCHACPGGCSTNTSGCGHGHGHGHGGVQAGYIGIILIVVIILSLVAYFVIGALLLKFHFQASGTDIIPNKSFWIQLPLLIKDGFVFTFSPCVKFIGEKTGRRNDYQKI